MNIIDMQFLIHNEKSHSNHGYEFPLKGLLPANPLVLAEASNTGRRSQ
jgi:hypothetical protein